MSWSASGRFWLVKFEGVVEGLWRTYTDSLRRAIRQASWFVHVRPSEGVFIVLVLVIWREGGTSPQPVKKRCWWSIVRVVVDVGMRLVSTAALGWEGCGPVIAGEDEGGANASVGSADDGGIWCEAGLDGPCCKATGANRSAT